jgi:hypothetical protein
VADFSDYIVFVDESGDHGLAEFSPDFPIFVLAVALIHKRAYVQEIVPSLQQMKMDFFGHDQVIFHERDIRRQLPPFGFLRQDANLRAHFLERLNEVMRAAEVELFCSVIRKEQHKARYADPWNPYEIALLFCLEQLRGRLIGLGQRGRRVDVIFESRGRTEDCALELEFRRIVTNQRRWGWRQVDFSCCEWVPHFIPKTSNSTGLQIADLAARPVGLQVLRPGQPNRAYDVVGPKVRAMKTFP